MAESTVSATPLTMSLPEHSAPLNSLAAQLGGLDPSLGPRTTCGSFTWDQNHGYSLCWSTWVGLDLDLQRWANIEASAREIPGSDILDTGEATYHVRSRKDPDRWYNIDLQTGHCDCASFPLVSFCKHISAVQMHLPDAYTLALFQAAPDTPHSELELPPGSDPALNADRDQHEDANHDSFHFARIGRKILDISAQAREGQLSHLTPILLDLEAGLDQAEAPLPKKIQVAPNQHTWPETAAVMVARPKTKHRTQTDPYGGGERSGKKVKSDTQVARTVLSRYAHHPSL